jgi:hypothetical protein
VATYGFFGGAGENGRRHRWRLLLHLGSLPQSKREDILAWARNDMLPSLLPVLERAPEPLWPLTLEWVPPEDISDE